MLKITTRQAATGKPQDSLVLPFDQRQKSRLRTRLESGQEVALLLERGGVLRGGEQLCTTDGRVVLIVAADEPVSRITAANPWLLIQAAYHLGNRHVPLEIGDGWLQIEQDHVLEHMVIGLGLQVTSTQAPFEPEAGAYGHGGHHHAEKEADQDQDHGHDHDHDHDHDHHHHHDHVHAHTHD